MAILVLLAGVVITLGGVVVLISPSTPMHVARKFFLEPGREYLALAIRFAFGVLFVVAGPYCRPEEPWVGWIVRLIGVLTILAVAVLLAIGRRRLRALIEWALNLPPSIFRLFAPVALVLGGFLIYAGW